MTDDIERLLARLPEPAPPPTLAATVMARIAREPDRAIVEAVLRSPAITRGDRPAWLWAVVGLLIVVGLTVDGWVSAGLSPDLTSSRIGIGRLALMPVEGPGVLLLAVGLWLFLLGLFAPLRRDREI